MCSHYSLHMAFLGRLNKTLEIYNFEKNEKGMGT